MVDKALYSSATVEWGTPDWLFRALDVEFSFTLDPCSTHENAKCTLHYTIEEDGLQQDWRDHRVFMNPPYGLRIGDWMRKAYESAKNGATVVCLVPVRSDTKWWHDYVHKGEIRLLCGRLKFEGGEHSAPFPSAIVVFRPPQYAIAAATIKAPGNQEKGHPEKPSKVRRRK